MSDAMDDLADEFRAVIDEAIGFAEECTPEQWQSYTSEEGWSVAATIHHIAQGNETVAGWIESMLAGDEIQLTPDEQDEDNAIHASEFAHANLNDTLDLLRSGGDECEALIRSLTDEDLSKAVRFGPAGGREVNVGQVAGAAVGHARTHLEHAQAAAGESDAG